MAATVTNAWGKPGAWALDSEEHEDELNQEKLPTPTTGTNQSAADFPDLTTAAATKTKKKKGKPLSLGEFVTGSTHKPTTHTYQAAKGLTTEDMMMLPTGPRQRTAEELDRSRLGGGFRSYGGDRNNDSSNSRWGSNRNTNGGDVGRKSSRESSRADETDDWGAQKKSAVAGGGGFDRREKSGFFEGSYSRAGESDRWVSNKSYTSPSESRRNVGFESSGGADSSENWGKKKEEERGRFGGRGGGGVFDSLRERRSGNELSDSYNWGRKREEAIGGGSMNRPKLNLQPRKLPVVDGGGDMAELKPNKGLNSNPFGDARPREEVLKEKGKDWREIDEKLESMKMKEAGSVDGSKRGFRTASAIEDQSEKNWRKNGSPSSDENSEVGNGEGEEGEA